MGLKASGERNLRRRLELKDEEIDELWETIECLNAKIEDAIPVPKGVGIKNVCIEIIRTEGKYIAAIKKYRDVTGASLKDAIDFVKVLRAEVLSGKHGEYHPSLRPF